MADSEDKEKELKKIAEEDRNKYKEEGIENIPQIVAAICPDYYASKKVIGKIKELKKKGKFWEAVSIAKPRDPVAGESYFISYNSSSEGLEPIYFWIIDFLGGDKVEKLIDNFSSSPGSGHFSELMGKATRMQEESMKVMQTIGVLIKSVIQIVYDLRQFEIRLNDYKLAKSKDKTEASAGLIALKQIWMDNVDIKRGNTSIKAMAFSQASFATLIDAFMATQSLEDIKKSVQEGGLDLNDRVKRILEQRFIEFEQWKNLSEKEIRKRYNIQKAYLKSQVDSIKLYSRWAKPYLKAAEELRMASSLSSSSSLVKAFNTMIMQLVIMQKKEVGVEDAVMNKNLPSGFERLEEKGKIRKYTSCVLVDLKFRGIPQRVDQHYAFGGKADVTFKSFALNNEELAELKKRLGESDLNDALKLVEGATTESLNEIKEDLDYFLKDEEDREIDEKIKEKKKEADNSGDINPFAALIGKGTFWGSSGNSSSSKKEDKNKGGEIRPDNYYEKIIRQLAIFNAKNSCFKVYDIYKKTHGMASVPIADQDSWQKSDVKVDFTGLFKS